MRLGSCGGGGDRDGDECFDEPDGNPTTRSGLAGGREGRGDGGEPHGDATPTGYGGEFAGRLHGLANVAKMVGSAGVDGNGLAFGRAQG